MILGLLPKQEITVCARVSKAWYNQFINEIYGAKDYNNDESSFQPFFTETCTAFESYEFNTPVS